MIGRVDNLEACEQQCIAYKGNGTCVLSSFFKQKRICKVVLTMNKPDVYLNVCKIDSKMATTARCTVAKFYSSNIK